MSNGQTILDEMEFEEKTRGMSDRKLLEFTARQYYILAIFANKTEKRVTGLENRSRRAFGLTGGAGAFIGAAIAALIDFIIRR